MTEYIILYFESLVVGNHVCLNIHLILHQLGNYRPVSGRQQCNRVSQLVSAIRGKFR